MNIRPYQCPFNTLYINLVELPTSISGNKYIFMAVCLFSNFLIFVPIPASTCAYVLLDHVFLEVGFPWVLQTDRGDEFFTVIPHRITELLKISHIFTMPH